ncbi:hypothetical protein ACSSS7_005140 [Eimeria intestinalis]
MASLAQRLSFWFFGGDSPPAVPHPTSIRPIILEAPFMLNLNLPLKGTETRAEIIDWVNQSVSDEELQAHGLQAMKDQLGWEFDPKQQPRCCWSAAKPTTAALSAAAPAAATAAADMSL